MRNRHIECVPKTAVGQSGDIAIGFDQYSGWIWFAAMIRQPKAA